MRGRPGDSTRWPTLGALLAAGALSLGSGCASAADDGSTGAGTWKGSISEEDGVTTVRNLEGSVWGDVATLVPEASIGVLEGQDEYMLGRIDGLWATGTEIYVLDTQVPAVRAYDRAGVYLRQVGRGGEGPGEYAQPAFLGGDDSGRLFVADYGTRRVTIYSSQGEYQEAWPMGNVFCCLMPMVVTSAGKVYLQGLAPDPDYGTMAEVFLAHGSDGAFGELIPAPRADFPEHDIEFNGRRMPTAFAPSGGLAISRAGEIITGVNNEYRFTVRRPDGTTLEVERAAEQVAVDGAEREWYRRSRIASLRRGEPGWSWDGAEIPQVKPAFTSFIPAIDGTLWVVRDGPGRVLPDCDPDADVDDYRAFQAARCWRDTEIVDVFDAEGVFLGEVAVPDEVNLRFAFPWISGDTVIASVVDDDGTIRVVRYRLRRPGDDDS